MALAIVKSTTCREVPSLVDGEGEAGLTAEHCGIEYWLHATPQGSLRGQIRGHAPGLTVPPHMLAPGPLREASLKEFAFRATTEQMTARNLSHLVRTAPDQATMDFFATQLLDEARHADIFRWHLVELGVPPQHLAATLADIVGPRQHSILQPLEEFAHRLIAHPGNDFIGGVIFLTVIGEGALAPAAEMSERKWRVFDPAASEISQGANLDEVRHLGVGAEIVRAHLQQQPNERPRLLSLIQQGMQLWQELPIFELLLEREMLFQAGLEQYRDLLGDYELVPGRRLADTSVEERIMLQSGWSDHMRQRRLARMGLAPGSIDFPAGLEQSAAKVGSGYASC